MKKILLLFAILPLLGLVSCSNDDEGDGSDTKFGKAVKFSASISEMSQTFDLTSWTDGDQVGLYMVEKGTTLVMNNARNLRYTADASGKLTAAGTGIGTLPTVGSDAIYFPESEKSLVDFIGYYPFQESLTNYTYAVNLKDQSNPRKIDLMYSANAVNVANSAELVGLQFDHKLAKIEFNITAGSGLTASDLAGMRINVSKLNTVAEFNLATNQLHNVRANETFTTLTASNGLTSQIIALPATGAMFDLEFILSNNISFEWKSVIPSTFYEGKVHTFNVSVGASSVVVSPAGITDWTGIGENPIAGSGKPVVFTIYNIGDVYPKDGTPIGIVYEVSNGGKNGKVVSLKEKQARWGDNTKDESADAVAFIRDNDNGRDATVNLINKRKTAANFVGDYVIFDWLLNEMNAGDVNGAWYIPSKNELKGLYAGISGLTYNDISTTWLDTQAMPNYSSTACNNARTAFNTQVTNAGGTAFNFYGQYWAVTEISANVGWSVHFSTSVLQNNKSKGDAFGRARAILAF